MKQKNIFVAIAALLIHSLRLWLLDRHLKARLSAKTESP